MGRGLVAEFLRLTRPTLMRPSLNVVSPRLGAAGQRGHWVNRSFRTGESGRRLHPVPELRLARAARLRVRYARPD